MVLPLRPKISRQASLIRQNDLTHMLPPSNPIGDDVTDHDDQIDTAISFADDEMGGVVDNDNADMIDMAHSPPLRFYDDPFEEDPSETLHLSQQVEITGLELLDSSSRHSTSEALHQPYRSWNQIPPNQNQVSSYQQQNQYSSYGRPRRGSMGRGSSFSQRGGAGPVEDEDFSFDSYANDSYAMVRMRMQGQGGGVAATAASGSGAYRNSNASTSRRRVQRRLSNCSSIGADSVDYGYSTSHNRYPPPTSRSMRRSSLGSYANDSVDYSRFHSKTSQRRSSLGSYANDSVDVGRLRSQRRSSLGSYANDSVDFNRMKSHRRSSLSSYANDSVEGNRMRSSAMRRSSLGSQYAMNGGGATTDGCATAGGGEHGSSLHGGAHARTTTCRNSLGLQPLCSSRHSQHKQQRRFSNYSDYANDSIDLNSCSVHSKSAVAGHTSFSQDVYETQFINTGGVGRAA